MSTETRNQQAENYVRDTFNLVRGKSLDELGVSAGLREISSPLFESTATGFREIVLTIIVAIKIGIKFKPSTEFYSCHPRAIYERGIRKVLDENRVRRGQSGPLNVAKNAGVLDENWARGRRPEDAAMAAVKLIKKIERYASNTKKMDEISFLVHHQLLAKAEEENITIEEPDGLTIIECFHLIMTFISEYPDAGNTPQLVVGEVLDGLKFSYQSPVDIIGLGETSCSTNITSKKPADLVEEINVGGEVETMHLYEVTVKPIDHNRIEDSSDAVLKSKTNFNVVTWLCRLPGDVNSLKLNSGETLICKGIQHEFIDLGSWLLIGLERLGAQGRAKLLKSITDYLESHNAKPNVKKGWNKIVGEISKG